MRMEKERAAIVRPFESPGSRVHLTLLARNYSPRAICIRRALRVFDMVMNARIVVINLIWAPTGRTRRGHRSRFNRERAVDPRRTGARARASNESLIRQRPV